MEIYLLSSRARAVHANPLVTIPNVILCMYAHTLLTISNINQTGAFEKESNHISPVCHWMKSFFLYRKAKS